MSSVTNLEIQVGLVHVKVREIVELLGTNKIDEISGGTYLDYGCEEGFVAAAIAKQIEASQIELVDVGERHNIPLVQSGEARYHAAKPGEILVPDVENSFDLVTVTDVLHHMRDIDDARLVEGFRRMKEKLSPKGKIVITCNRSGFEGEEHSRRLKRLLAEPDLAEAILHDDIRLKALNSLRRIKFG